MNSALKVLITKRLDFDILGSAFYEGVSSSGMWFTEYKPVNHAFVLASDCQGYSKALELLGESSHCTAFTSVYQEQERRVHGLRVVESLKRLCLEHPESFESLVGGWFDHIDVSLWFQYMILGRQRLD